jgi:hypothetical protein
MRYITWFLGLVVILVTMLYLFLFTPFGNSMIQPVVESKIDEATHLQTHFKKFSLSLNHIDIDLQLDANNTIACRGEYSIWKQSFSLTYDVALHNLEGLRVVTQTPLYGVFNTEGNLSGDAAFMKIDGVSDLAKSTTDYHIELTQFEPTSIGATLHHLYLERLLFMLNQKAYASGMVDMDLHFKNIQPHHLDGTVLLTTRKGRLNPKVMQKDFNITIPKTAFSMKLDAKLLGDDVQYNYTLHSNIAKIASHGTVVPQPL